MASRACWASWRTDRREQAAYQRATEARRETRQQVETLEVVRARAQVETAREGAAYASAPAAAITARAGLPGFGPNALTTGSVVPELTLVKHDTAA